MKAPADKRGSDFATVAKRPTLYLIYLVFLFFPWIFTTFTWRDGAVAALAVALFLPVHYWGFRRSGGERLAAIGAMVTLGVITAPLTLGHSVFHVYASASAGFLRPVRRSALIFALCTLVYLASALLFERHLFEIAMALLISTIVWVSCFSSAEVDLEHEQAERARALDVQQASLVERERIARDLHDLLGHTLTLVSLKADLAQRMLEGKPAQPEAAREELASLQKTSREALGEVRAVLSGLTATTVAAELRNGRRALEAAGIELSVRGPQPALTAEQETAFGLMVREAVTNVIRHSSASKVLISFEEADGLHSLQVHDDGDAAGLREGSGLGGLRARLENLGGMLTVSSGPGVRLRGLLPP